MLTKLRRPASTFTITQLCREFSTTPRALRYYEEQGCCRRAAMVRPVSILTVIAPG